MRLLRGKLLLVASILLVLSIFPGCEALKKMSKEANMYTPKEDLSFGRDLRDRINSDPQNYPIYNKNSEVKRYLQGIIEELKKSSKLEYKDVFAYQVEVIDDDNVINAFATPGGYIYVYTGLLKFLDNEATLAGVLAHEMAHAARRHSTRRLTAAKSMDYLTSELKKQDYGDGVDVAADLFSGMALLSNSREDEFEADEYSFEYLRATKWYPGSIQMFFDKIKGSAEPNQVAVLLSTHPLPQDRYDAVTQRLKKANINPPNEENLFHREYVEFKKSI